MKYLEHIRMEVGGRAAKVLHRIPCRSIDADFQETAREMLANYYEPGCIQIKEDLQTNPDQPAKNAEAVRLVCDADEIRRYDLYDLRGHYLSPSPRG